MTFNKYILGFVVAALMMSAGISGIAYADKEDNQGEHRGWLSSLFHWNKGEKEDKDDNEKKNEDKVKKPALEVTISADGKVLVRGAKVTGRSDSTVSATTTWGSTDMNWTINTNSSTQFITTDNTPSISDISVGDIVSFKGSLTGGNSSSMTVSASIVRNWSGSTTDTFRKFEGTVSSTSTSPNQFVLATNNNGNVTVMVSGSTAITKDSSTVSFSSITVGSKVSAEGTYTVSSKTLDASKVKIKPTPVATTTLQGTLKSVAGTSAPTSLVMTSGSTDYTVNISSSTSVLNNAWAVLPLSDFSIGNTIRAYGTVNSDDSIDATVVRNISK